MCGIVGGISENINIVDIIFNGLKKLEYRGYDSSGIALINHKHELKAQRTIGNIDNLLNTFNNNFIFGKIGIAHTRWATHGKPTINNAHPQISNDTIAVVHNGIIENYSVLKKKLQNLGFVFSSETDTEVIAHLIFYHFSINKYNFLKAIHETIKELSGSYAFAAINTLEPDKIISVKYNSPVIIGLGDNGNFLASDPIALIPITNRFIYLIDGDIALIKKNEVIIYDNNLELVNRELEVSDMSVKEISLGSYQHFMQKEIFEQPKSLLNTINNLLSKNQQINENLINTIHRIQIVACGSSYHAAIAGQYWFEQISKIPCRIEIASEFRYRCTVPESNTLFIAISQSGETADTLAALRKAKELNFMSTLAICNVAGSSLVRESKLSFITKAGIEIGVATTKAFTSQLVALFILANLFKSKNKENLSNIFIDQLQKIPILTKQVLSLNKSIIEIANILNKSKSIFYIARGINYSIALEGALKLKEISYCHVESYPAGELKHGSLALIDSDSVIVVIAPSNDDVYEKLYSNLHEISARGGKLIIFTDDKNIPNSWHKYIMPTIPIEITPIIYTIPLQLLAYHVACLKGTNIDRPRNLAKSVTVE